MPSRTKKVAKKSARRKVIVVSVGEGGVKERAPPISISLGSNAGNVAAEKDPPKTTDALKKKDLPQTIITMEEAASRYEAPEKKETAPIEMTSEKLPFHNMNDDECGILKEHPDVMRLMTARINKATALELREQKTGKPMLSTSTGSRRRNRYSS